MATFATVTRKKNEYNSVYIRITHARSIAYIKTHYSVHKSAVKKGQIMDYAILANCALKIKSYVEKLNSVEIKNWSVLEIKDFLESSNEQLSFTDFANTYVDEMEVQGRRKPAANYKTALNSLHRFYDKPKIRNKLIWITTVHVERRKT